MHYTPRLAEHGLYDIYEYWHIPWWQTSTFYFIVCIICGAVIAALLYWLIYVYRVRAIRKQPWDIALVELQSLKFQPIDTVTQIKKSYDHMCWILKKYLGARFSVELYDKSEQEVVMIMKTVAQMQPELLQDLHDILHGGSLVKFANVSVAQEYVLMDIDRSMTFVRSTSPTQATNR